MCVLIQSGLSHSMLGNMSRQSLDVRVPDCCWWMRDLMGEVLKTGGGHTEMEIGA